jgi:hypothetical protein
MFYSSELREFKNPRAIPPVKLRKDSRGKVAAEYFNTASSQPEAEKSQI